MTPEKTNQSEVVPFDRSTAIGAIEIITHSRKLHMYPVSDYELNSLKDSGLSATVDIALFTLCCGTLTTLIVTLSTVPINDPKIFAAYVAATVVSFVGVAFFGARSFLAWRSAKAKLEEIKGSS